MPAIRLRELAVMAWKLSHLSTDRLQNSPWMVDSNLLGLWKSLRSASQHWQRSVIDLNLELPDISDESSAMKREEWLPEKTTAFAQLAHEILLCDQLIRVFCSVAAWADLRRNVSEEEFTEFPAHASVPARAFRCVLGRLVEYSQFSVHLILPVMLQPGCAAVGDLDRLRRRSERWTDLLCGPWFVRTGAGEFAHDPSRAWAYGEESLEQPESKTAHYVLAGSFAEAFRAPALLEPVTNQFLQEFCDQIHAFLESLLTASSLEDLPDDSLSMPRSKICQASSGTVENPFQLSSLPEHLDSAETRARRAANLLEASLRQIRQRPLQ